MNPAYLRPTLLGEYTYFTKNKPDCVPYFSNVISGGLRIKEAHR